MKQAIGIDIGGTKIAVGLVNVRGEIAATQTFATAEVSRFPVAVERLTLAITQVCATAGIAPGDLAGIGIGAAGPLDPVTGVIQNPETLPVFTGESITAALGERFTGPVRLENDADAALVGEVWIGAARGAHHAAMLTFGTGIGGAIWTSDRLLRGSHGVHPEIGHMPVEAGGPSCLSCRQRGCLESVASGTAITTAGQAVGFADARAVFAAARAGDERAIRIVERVAAACGTAMWTLIHLCHPERVIFGGSVMEAHFSLVADPVRRAVAPAGYAVRHPVTLCAAMLGNRAGIVGAAALMLGVLEQLDS